MTVDFGVFTVEVLWLNRAYHPAYYHTIVHGGERKVFTDAVLVSLFKNNKSLVIRTLKNITIKASITIKALVAFRISVKCAGLILPNYDLKIGHFTNL